MTATIDDVRAATADEWDDHWLTCPTATYFQSRDWAEIWAAYELGELVPDARVVRFAGGPEVVLPLSRQPILGGLASRWWCSPMTTYGGWLCAGPLDSGHVEALCAFVRERLGCVTWRMNPLVPSPSQLDEHWSHEPDETLALALGCGFDQLRKACARGHRRAARKAASEGVVVRPAATHDDWAAYVAAYEDSRRRWGAARGHGAGLFAEFERRAGDWCRLWVAEAEGEVLGGLLCLYAPRHVACWHAAVFEEALGRHPMPLVFLTAMEDACARGAEWFDFNPSKGLAGVEEFKRRFGAQPLSCPVLRCERGLGVRTWRLLRRVTGRSRAQGSLTSGAAPQ
ncbi:MAG: GNAT family N-acetyltransferase [Thermoleophilia bacterium]|nr:GNAT family N-acetyltransferase [Thermoleophilia bacterium]